MEHTNDSNDYELARSPSGYMTAMRIAEANHVSWNTIYKYSVYARTINEIGRKAPDIASLILSGRYKISQKNLTELSKMTAEQIETVATRLEQDRKRQVQNKSFRKEISVISQRENKLSNGKVATIKDMPSFDPDSELTALALTIPSWAGSIERAIQKTDFSIASLNAKAKLVLPLQQLHRKISDLLSILKED
ncbi:MAG: hypothetical protein IK085_04865 [Clostridia bacterium]|nr:hypothetical protein [Clostridia bacterium]